LLAQLIIEKEESDGAKTAYGITNLLDLLQSSGAARLCQIDLARVQGNMVHKEI
jgi:hypothetical protein